MQFQNDSISKFQSRFESRVTFPPRRKYLVVEDDFTLQPLWEQIIRANDPKAVIRWAVSEEGAEKLLEDCKKTDHQFDFVIADVVLAGQKNGVDLFKKYRDSEILFLFSSGISEKKFAKLIGKENAEYPFFLQKPLNIVECMTTIGALIDFQKLGRGSVF